jgi:hypothetical protein
MTTGKERKNTNIYIHIQFFFKGDIVVLVPVSCTVLECKRTNSYSDKYENVVYI